MVQADDMVALYAIASISVAFVAGILLLPSMGWWGIATAWLAANVAGAGVAVAISAARRRQNAVTDRIVAELRSVVAAADIGGPDAGPARQVDRRVA